MALSRRNTLVIGLVGLALVTVVSVRVQQQPGVQAQTAAPGGTQPGLRWTEDQFKEAIAPIRAGRKLTPKSWPGGARVAVCLSFDVDSNIGLRTGQTEPVELSSGEFGATIGLARVLALLDRHNVPASFFIPAVSAMLYPHTIPEILKSKRHEIAVHGWIHENIQELNDAREEERLLTQAIDYLTKATGKRPVGYRSPSWSFSPYTLGLLRKAGFSYDSSLQAMDEPYEVVADGKPISLIALPSGWTMTDSRLLNVRTGSLPSPELVFQMYKDEFDVAYQEGTMLMLTLHPNVMGRRSAIVHLDKMVSYMKSKPGVWFATGEQITQYIKQQFKLKTN